MSIPFHLPPVTGSTDVKVFTRSGADPAVPDTFEVQSWTKPQGVTSIFFLVVGGGSGGGSGFTGIAGSARGGGGGGASGSAVMLFAPAHLVPNDLYVSAGFGGGTGGGTLGRGQTSVIVVRRPSTTTNRFLHSSDTFASAGGAGTGSAGGAGGVSGGNTLITNVPLAGVGIFQSLDGQNGVAGGAQTGADGTSITIPATGAICCGGSGGAGVTATAFAGGGVNAITDSWLSEQRPAPPATGSNNGSGGRFLLPDLFWGFGGVGGSSSNAGIGGFGGTALYGAGGGGGGGGTTGGTGGRGGPGIVVIISW